MVYVEGGPFVMGSDPGEGDPDEEPEHQVTLSSFAIDKYEVTNNRYRMCVIEGTCTPPKYPNAPGIADYYSNSAYDDYPVVWVTWQQAQDYCEWIGRALPTEAQWERAARGPSPDERTYPWGDSGPDCTRANSVGCYGSPQRVTDLPDGASPSGALHMAGNVAEWVADYYEVDSYGACPVSCSDPAGPDTGTDRVLRGGGFVSSPLDVRVAARDKAAPDVPGVRYDRGFRCGLRDSLTYYVDADAAPGGDGLSWASAFRDVRAAGEAASLELSPGVLREIRVAEGVYWLYDGQDDDPFLILSGVWLRGGYVGQAAPEAEPDPQKHVTVLAGNEGPARMKSLETVVVVQGTLDGVVVTGGHQVNANAGAAGVWLKGGMLSNSIVTGNGNSAAAHGFGGGVGGKGANGVIDNCVLTGNSVTVGSAGGAVCTAYNSSGISIRDTVLVGNSAAGSGSHGPAAYFDSQNVVVINTVVAGNASGGSMAVHGGAAITLRKSTFFASNFLLLGDPTATTGAFGNVLSLSVSLTNSVVRAASADGLTDGTISYTNILGGASGVGNIDADPKFRGFPLMEQTGWASVSFDMTKWQTVLVANEALFTPGALVKQFVQLDTADERWAVIADNTDTTLRVWGDWTDLAQTTDTWRVYDLHLDAGSPCIDAGDGDSAPETDIDGNPRVDDPATPNSGAGTPNYTDMGAYEYQP